MSHYLVRCSGCKAIIEQCRCPGPKTERAGLCGGDSCLHDAATPAPDKSAALTSPSPRLSACAGITTDYARGVHIACECVGRDLMTLRAEVEDHRALCERNDKALRARWFEEKARADKAEAEVEERKRQLDALMRMRSDDIKRAHAKRDALLKALREIALEHADGCDYMEYGKPCNCARTLAAAAIKEAGE